MAGVLGVTGPQRLVIRIVGRFPGISAGRLAGILHLHPSTLTGIVRRLERRGLLTRRRDPRDGRRIALGLSAAGRRLDVESSGAIEPVTRGVLATLPRRDTLAARRVLMALAARLQAPSAPARGPRALPR
jgi:DNA-binding MarR family transcriptional regulator